MNLPIVWEMTKNAVIKPCYNNIEFFQYPNVIFAKGLILIFKKKFFEVFDQLCPNSQKKKKQKVSD